MGQLIAANVANNLYWFGRHIERVEATLIEITRLFDEIIDVDKDAGKKFYRYLEVELEYDGALSFLDNAIFGEHTANLYDIMVQARENAIIARVFINTEAFGTVIDLYELFHKASKDPSSIDYQFVDTALSLISEIWGGINQLQDRENSDNFIRLGKLVEKVDFHLNIGRNKEFALTIISEIDSIVYYLAPNAMFMNLTYSDIPTIIDSVNNKINQIIIE